MASSFGGETTWFAEKDLLASCGYRMKFLYNFAGVVACVAEQTLRDERASAATGPDSPMGTEGDKTRRLFAPLPP